MRYSLVEGWWKDTGKPEDILDANHMILDNLKAENKGKVENSMLKGRISIEENSIIKENSVIKGPVIIGKNCLISNAYIGPYTSIGDNSQIINTEIEDSIVMEAAKIVNAEKIVESLIGKNVNIEKDDNLPTGRRFIIGDCSKVRI